MTLYTDGSFKSHPTPLQSMFRLPGTRTTAAGAIVAVPTDATAPALQHHTVRALRLTNAHTVCTKSVFGIELLSLASALSAPHPPATVVTDSESSRKLLLFKNLRRAASHPHVTIIHAGQSYRQSNIRHVRSHQGDHTPSHTWTPDVLGNHLADTVAGGLDHTHGIQINVTTVDAQVPLYALAQNLFWSWRYNDSPLTRSAQDIILDQRLHDYLTTRDDYRHQANLPPIWTDSTVHLLADLYLTGRRTLPDRAAAQRAALLKGDTGRNRAKRTTPTLPEEEAAELIQCDLCNEIDDEDHTTRHCTHPEVLAARTTALLHLNSHITLHRTDPPLHRLLCHLRDTALFHHSGWRVWLGLWTPQLLADLQLNHPTLQELGITRLRSWTRAIKTLHQILADHIRTRWAIRCRTVSRDTYRSSAQAREQHLAHRKRHRPPRPPRPPHPLEPPVLFHCRHCHTSNVIRPTARQPRPKCPTHGCQGLYLPSAHNRPIAPAPHHTPQQAPPTPPPPTAALPHTHTRRHHQLHRPHRPLDLRQQHPGVPAPPAPTPTPPEPHPHTATSPRLAATAHSATYHARRRRQHRDATAPPHTQHTPPSTHTTDHHMPHSATHTPLSTALVRGQQPHPSPASDPRPRRR